MLEVTASIEHPGTFRIVDDAGETFRGLGEVCDGYTSAREAAEVLTMLASVG